MQTTMPCKSREGSKTRQNRKRSMGRFLTRLFRLKEGVKEKTTLLIAVVEIEDRNKLASIHPR